MADITNGFNRKLDLITEREVVYDFVSRLSIGKDWVDPEDEGLIFDADINFKNILRQISKVLPESIYRNLQTISTAAVEVPVGTTTVTCDILQSTNTKDSLILAMSERTQLDIKDCFTLSSTSSTTKYNQTAYNATYTMTTDVPYDDPDVIKFYAICASVSGSDSTDRTNKTSVTIPSQSGTLTYNGFTQYPTWNDYDESLMTISGNTNAVNAGTYTAVFTLIDTSNYQWSDGTITSKSVSWTIGKTTTNIPSQSGTLTYNGSVQSPSWNDFDGSIMSIGGTTSATDAGTYTAIFTLIDTSNYQWSDGTTGTQSVTWTILDSSRTNVTIPTAFSSSYPYIGRTITPTFNDYDSSLMTIGGTTSATAVGTYTTTFTLIDTVNYQWSDGTTGTQSVSWNIAAVSSGSTDYTIMIIDKDDNLYNETDGHTIMTVGEFVYCEIEASGTAYILYVDGTEYDSTVDKDPDEIISIEDWTENSKLDKNTYLITGVGPGFAEIGFGVASSDSTTYTWHYTQFRVDEK